MGEPEKKPEIKPAKKSIAGKVVLFLVTLVLALGVAAWFVPAFSCPVCTGIDAALFISRPSKGCEICEGTKKVNLPKFLEKKK